MKTTLQLAVAISAALLIPGSAWAASDYLLELEGVEGEARTGSRTIEVQSFSWGTSNAGSMTASKGGGAGKASMQDMSRTVAAPRDASSGLPTGRRSAAATSVEGAAAATAVAPAVREVSVMLPEGAARSMCVTGKHITKANLVARGERVQLENVVVTACTTQGGVSTVAMRGHQKTGHVTLMK